MRHGYYLAGALFAAYLFLVLAPARGSVGLDAFAYWSASPPLYDAVWGDLGAYVDSPASAFVLHTKPTCSVGLLWFVFRREWRSLVIALGATAAVAGFSFALMPGAWREYVDGVGRRGGRPGACCQGCPSPSRRAPSRDVIRWGSLMKAIGLRR